jgi:type IV pilus assembly protein PilM
LDIGTTTVRLLQLGGTEKDLRVVDAAKFVIPQEVKSEPARRRERVVEGLRRLLKERRFRGREAVSALAVGELAIRNVRLPKMPEEALDTAVNWEAQNRFPFDTATAIIQHLPAGEVRQGEQVLDEVILFAAPRAEVDARVQLACEAGLDVVSLDAEPCAVFRAFERFLRRRDDETTVSVFVDIGAETTVAIARGRNVVFVKMIPIGGLVFNRAVAECLELSVAEAEALRRRLGRNGSSKFQVSSSKFQVSSSKFQVSSSKLKTATQTGRSLGTWNLKLETLTSDTPDEETDRVCRAVADAIRPHLEDLANEIALCLRYYSVTFRGQYPESVTFTGGEATSADIPTGLAERLGVAVQIGDLFRAVKMDHPVPALDRRGVLCEWTTAFGLSLKGFHLAEQLAAGYAS